MFEVPQVKVARPLILLRRTCILVVSAYLVIGMIAAYRAYYQVHSLDLQLTDSILRPGSAVETTVVSYARTTVDVRLELVQGQRSVTLGFNVCQATIGCFLIRAREKLQRWPSSRKMCWINLMVVRPGCAPRRSDDPSGHDCRHL